MSTVLKVEGIEEISKALKQLGGREAQRAVANATRDAARVLVKDLKRSAPKGKTGNLRNSIRVSRPWAKGGKIHGTPIKAEYYGYILEGGVDAKRGLTFAAKNWISNSVRDTAQKSIDVFSQSTWKHISAQWEKYVKRRRG